MTWDGMRKRSSDNSKEEPEVILARVDENIKFLKSGAELVRIQLDTHEKKDDVKFKEIDEKQNNILKNIYFASGGLAVIVFFLNLIHK